MNEYVNKSKDNRLKKMIFLVVLYIIIASLIVLFSGLAYLRKTWPDISYIELAFHLKTTFGGTNPEMIYSALLKYALPAAIVIIIVLIAIDLLRRKNKKSFKIVTLILLIGLLLSDFLSIYTYNDRTHILSDYFHSVFRTNDSDFIGKIYVNPADVEIEFPEQKRNLIYVYIESMEMSFANEDNGGFYSDNFIPNLTALAEEDGNDDFSGDDKSTLNGGISLPGTQWTTGAMFAQTSGLPLDIPVHENTISNPEQFFPTIVTMGDILKEAGYTNIVEMGSTAGFGGKAAYYRRHGDYEIHDYDYAINQGYIPEDYEVWWGYEDEKLFDFAKKEITELANSESPFNYTMITVDTHTEGGYVCRLCEDEFGDNQYGNVLACSDRQVVGFVKWIQQQDFYDNTTIVLTGDHPTMDAGFVADIPSDYQRKTYTCIINSAVEPQLNTKRDFSTIDIFPTILASLGVQMSSDRLGCGTNLYGTEQTILEEYGIEECKAEFSMQSPFVESLVSLKVDDDTMEEVKNGSYLEVADENGYIRFRLIDIDRISRLDVNELTLLVHDDVTNEDYEYDMAREDKRSGWLGMVHSNIPYTDVEHLSCKVYISVDDYKHYLIKDVTSKDLAMWNVNWDFE